MKKGFGVTLQPRIELGAGLEISVFIAEQNNNDVSIVLN